MEILYILVPLSIILVAIAVYILGWAVKSGQFDDLEGPAHRILYDDDEHMIPKGSSTKKALRHSQDTESHTRD